MAAALECWSSRASTDEDMVEQVLMRTNDRSEGSPKGISAGSGGVAGAGASKESSAMQKRLQKLSRNVSEALASLKNTLNLDSARDVPPLSSPTTTSSSCSSSKVESCRKVVWGSVVRNLTQLYPGSQLPEKLVSNIRKHYDSLPLRFGFNQSQRFSLLFSFFVFQLLLCLVTEKVEEIK